MVDVPDATETTGASAAAEATAEPEHPALSAYRAKTRRASRVYASVLVVLVVIGFLAVKLAYAHGELNKVSFATAPAAAPVSGSTPAPRLQRAWHTDDTAAGGTPYQDGIVVTYRDHTVNGRDAVTGQVRWHYTRADDTVCSVLQQDSSTIAIYRRKGNCDEVTGFVTATGTPKYYRTLTDDGTTDAASLPNVVLTVGAHFVHEFDNAGGLDRWEWDAPDGCAVTRALAGSLGTLISLDCAGRHQLVLRDLIQNTTKFTVDTPTAVVPIASSAFVGALDPATGTVYSYSQDKGAAKVASTLTGVRTDVYPRAAASLSTTDAEQQQIEFVLAGRLVTFSSDGSVRWTATASSAPALVTGAFVAVADGPGRVVLHRVDAGQVQLSSSVSPPAGTTGSAPAGSAPAGSAGSVPRVFGVGAGLLVIGTDVSLYR